MTQTAYLRTVRYFEADTRAAEYIRNWLGQFPPASLTARERAELAAAREALARGMV